MRTVFDLKNAFEYAMHGNGAYRGLRQTNTKDAMLYWYGKGVRIFEIDMAKTDDDEYVAVAHYMSQKDLSRLELFDLPTDKNLDWFMQQKLFSISCHEGLQPLSLREIVNFLSECRDVIVMLDLFGMFSLDETERFVKKLSDYFGPKEEIWDRVLIEAYNPEMIEGINKGSIKANVIYCARFEENEDEETAVSAESLLKYGVRFVSYPWYITAKHAGEIENYAHSGITVFSRTKDNRNEDVLKKAGVAVNIIAMRYDGLRILYQYPLYMMTYIKRVFVKIYIKAFKEG